MSSAEEYERELQRAQQADLTAVAAAGAVRIVWGADERAAPDKDGRVVIVVLPALLPRADALSGSGSDDAWEQAFQLFVRETAAVGAHAFHVVLALSGLSGPASCGAVVWARSARQRLSPAMRELHEATTLLHPGLAARALLLGARAWGGAAAWSGLRYADRVEELWLDGTIARAAVRSVIPRAVWRYERVMVDEAEMVRQEAILHGAPLGVREGVLHAEDEDGGGAERADARAVHGADR